MQVKLLEIRDEATFIPVLCVDMNPGSLVHDGTASEKAIRQFNENYESRRYLLRRYGYPCDGRPNIAMTRLSADGTPCWNDPYGWSRKTDARTMPNAHNWIIEHWDDLRDGDVVDVEHILGETSAPKVSERLIASV